MKKLFIFTLTLFFVLGLSACSTSNNQNAEKKTTTEKTDVKKPLVKFYMDLVKKINEKDIDLNAYEKAPASNLQAKASQSAGTVATEIAHVQIPKELNKQKVQLNTALKDLSSSYQQKADELKKSTPHLDAANAAFAKGDDELGNVLVSAKLLKPSLAKELQ